MHNNHNVQEIVPNILGTFYVNGWSQQRPFLLYAVFVLLKIIALYMDGIFLLLAAKVRSVFNFFNILC